MDILNIVGREKELFHTDIAQNEKNILNLVKKSKFLVIGGAGSIGKAVSLEIFKRNPKVLHIVDISENNMVELVRSIRSSIGYKSGDFRTFALDCGGPEFEIFFQAEGPYDYIFNLSALKHVRSEKDPYTLMRLINVNIFNSIKMARLARDTHAVNYFCVSTDKAANPVNMMGASKLIMEKYMIQESISQSISMARFANVAFSDGSLLHGFNQRILQRQPISAPSDVKRYFVTPQESGELCILSGLLGMNRDIFFPKLSDDHHLESFPDIVSRYIYSQGYEPTICETEDEARGKVDELIKQKKWPVYFFSSNTTGEKFIEEFYTENEVVDITRFSNIGVINKNIQLDHELLKMFSIKISELKEARQWTKQDLVRLFEETLQEFNHIEVGSNLDNRM